MKIKAGYECRRMGGHSMVVRQVQGEEKTEILFALNETGAYLWDGLAKGKNKKELLDELMVEYEAGPEEKNLIDQDIQEFMEQLRMMGALED